MPDITSAIIAAVAALIGSIIGGFFTLGGVKQQASHTERLAISNDKRLQLNLLLGLRSEITELTSRYNEAVKEVVDHNASTTAPDECIHIIWPIYSNYFSTYDANSHLLASIENHKCKEAVISYYIRCKGFVDSFKFNNQMAQAIYAKILIGEVPPSGLTAHFHDYAKEVKNSADSVLAAYSYAKTALNDAIQELQDELSALKQENPGISRGR